MTGLNGPGAILWSMATHVNEEFTNVTVPLDGEEFRDCTFRNCLFVYRGGPPPTLDNCSFYGFTMGFDGAAGQTLKLLWQLYHGGFQSVIESTLNNIRGATPPKSWGGTVH